VYLHGQPDRGVVAEQHQHFGNSGATQHGLDLGKVLVRQLDPGDERRGEAVDRAFMRIGKLGIDPAADRFDCRLRNPGLTRATDVGVEYILAVPVACDQDDADLDLAY